MIIRPAILHDKRNQIPWLRADDPEGARVLVAERDGRVLAAGMRSANPLHPHLDALEFISLDGSGSDLLRQLAALGTADLLMRGLPDTLSYQAAIEAGAEVIEKVPASRIDTADPEVIAWCAAHARPTRPGTAYSVAELTRLWIRYYCADHQSIGLTDDQDVIADQLGRFVQEHVNRTLTRLVDIDGIIVAGAIMYVFDDTAYWQCH